MSSDLPAFLISEVRKRFVSAHSSPAPFLNLTTHRDQLASTGAQRTATNKVCHSLAFWQVFACMWEFVMCVCVYDSFWVTAVPLGAQPGQCRRVCVWVFVWERVKRVCTCLYACVHISFYTFVCVFICPVELPGPEHPPSDDSRPWLHPTQIFFSYFELSKSVFF